MCSPDNCNANLNLKQDNSSLPSRSAKMVECISRPQAPGTVLRLDLVNVDFLVRYNTPLLIVLDRSRLSKAREL